MNSFCNAKDWMMCNLKYFYVFFFLQNKFLIVILFCFVYSCKINGSELSKRDSILIDIDVTKENVVNYSDYFRTAKTIILETKKESLIGSITKCIAFDEKLFILDAYVAKALLVFDIDGKFIQQIGNIGRGPGEYQYIKDFTINEENKELYILANVNELLKYKTNGTFLKSIPIKITTTLVNFIQYYNGNIFAHTSGHQSGINEKMLLKIDKETGKVLKEYIDSWEYNCGWNERINFGHSFFFPVANGAPKFAAALMNSLFSLDNILPAITVKSKHVSTKEDLKYISTGNLSPVSFRKLFDIQNYIEHNKFIYFNVTVEGQPISIIYDISSKTSKIFKYFGNDLVYIEPRQFPKFAHSDAKGVYEIIVPDVMDVFLLNIKNNNISQGLDKMELLKKLDEESNPVIFYYEFK